MNKEIKNIFDNLTPKEEEKQKIWNEIEKKIEVKISKENRKNNTQNIWKRTGKTVGAAAAILIVFFMLGLCANAATNGKVTKVLQKLTGKEEVEEKEKAEKAKKEVIEETLKITQKMTVYAPEIYACTERYLVFAHLRGMVIYDRKEDAVASVVDLQKIDCNNFDSHTRFTRIILDGENLIIFNEENGEADSIYYECSLAGDLKENSLTKKERNKDLCSTWKKYKKSHYADTFDSLPLYVDTIDGVSTHQYLNYKVMYSENSFGWEGEDGSLKQSTLIVQYDKKKENRSEGASYVLLTVDKEGKEYQKEKLNIQLTLEETEEDYLPRFLYTGEDEQMAAICEMMYKKFNNSGDSGENISSVFIPEPVILGSVEEEGEQIVFVKLNYDFFIKNGNVLEDYGGARLSARLRLTRTEEGLTVKKCELAGDGARNREDINRFTKNYPKFREAYYDYEETEAKLTLVRQEMLQMYREETGLDIAYYKYSGWDKEKILEKRDTKLPKFSYKGKDKVMEAVCDYLCQKEAEGYEDMNGVYLPLPIIFDTKKQGDTLVVFGVFSCEIGRQEEDDTLQLFHGSERMGRMTLDKEKDGEGYYVTQYLYVEAGDLDWGVTMENFTQDYQDMRKKFYSFYSPDSSVTKEIRKIEKLRKQIIKMYVKDNELPFTAYRSQNGEKIRF